MVRKWPKNGPKIAQKGPKKASKWGQNDTKTSPKWCQNDVSKQHADGDGAKHETEMFQNNLRQLKILISPYPKEKDWKRTAKTDESTCGSILHPVDDIHLWQSPLPVPAIAKQHCLWESGDNDNSSIGIHCGGLRGGYSRSSERRPTLQILHPFIGFSRLKICSVGAMLASE